MDGNLVYFMTEMNTVVKIGDFNERTSQIPGKDY